MVNSLAELSQMIACPVCKLKTHKSWYYETGYDRRKKAFVLFVHFECCVCDKMVQVFDKKLAYAVYQMMHKPSDSVNK